MDFKGRHFVIFLQHSCNYFIKEADEIVPLLYTCCIIDEHTQELKSVPTGFLCLMVSFDLHNFMVGWIYSRE